ncbi:MAG: Osmosensitive channel histidine kinase KdpD, partial [Labilithrix sp.]|nr:Osmosensitive channel histidine kinase KdpD [Labilithrix sp.]
MAERPDPDVLLADVRREEERSRRGKLTIFFGSAPGVGKTYAMLESARLEREEGRDVVVGVVETHGRYDTGALLLGLELLPRVKIEHRGVKLEELDLDAALDRRAGLILVDELAHTNAPGSRHAKRWQDIEELLAAGLDVYSTLNVQHLESLNDVVAQITHVIVRETVPDDVFERADDVRLIDLPIDELLERLREGKVYVPEQAARARRSFFREGNLIALRELALRLTAQRVDAQMREYREKHGIDRTWPVAERVLVCVSPSPASERLVRAARRLATTLHGDWIAVYVETPASLRLSEDDRRRVTEHLRLAQGLGAETVTLSGASSPEEVTRFARARNVTRIVVGKPTHPSWRDWMRSSFLDQVVRLSGDIEVNVLSGEAPRSMRPHRSRNERSRRPLEPTAIVAAVAMLIATTTVGKTAFASAQLADVVMLYLLSIVLVSLRWGLWPSLLTAILSVFALDYFFIPPYHTFAVSDVSHVTTFGVMFIVALVISGLTKRVRDQGEAARERETRTASLYSLSGALARAKTTSDVAAAGAQHVHDVFGMRASVLVPGARGHLTAPVKTGAWSFVPGDKELGVAEWTWINGRAAGAGTDTLPSAKGSYLPLEASGTRVGVLGVEMHHGRERSHDQRQHLAAFAGQIAGALERTRLGEKAHHAQLRVEAEQLRNSLLSSVSHDLRTPLAVITGAASALLEGKLDEPTQRDLTETVLTEAELLNRLVRNLLDMTRLEAGAVEVKKEWQPIEEAVGAALERVDRIVGDRKITTELPAELPLVPYDSVLLQQVLVNLLENAVKYTPPGTEISVGARVANDTVEVEVADRGPGLPPGEESKIFTKFYRAAKGRGGGVGLGLTICQGIVTAHGGRIWAKNRE